MWRPSSATWTAATRVCRCDVPLSLACGAGLGCVTRIPRMLPHLSPACCHTHHAFRNLWFTAAAMLRSALLSPLLGCPAAGAQVLCRLALPGHLCAPLQVGGAPLCAVGHAARFRSLQHLRTTNGTLSCTFSLLPALSLCCPRDCAEEIRATAIEGIGGWVRLHPGAFLTDQVCVWVDGHCGRC